MFLKKVKRREIPGNSAAFDCETPQKEAAATVAAFAAVDVNVAIVAAVAYSRGKITGWGFSVLEAPCWPGKSELVPSLVKPLLFIFVQILFLAFVKGQEDRNLEMPATFRS